MSNLLADSIRYALRVMSYPVAFVAVVVLRGAHWREFHHTFWRGKQ